MKLYVIFGERKGSYEGQYGLEALACMSEYDNDENPDYLRDTLAEHRTGSEFSCVGVVTLAVNETAIRKVLRPDLTEIPAAVCYANTSGEKS